MPDAFVDESWSSGSIGDGYCLVVVSVVTTNRRRLELLARRLRRIPKLKTHSEFKASVTPPDVVKKLLRTLADDPDLSIVVAVWRGKKSKIGDVEKTYQELVGRCALHVVRRNKRIDLFIDKRYTNRSQQRELEGEIRTALAAVSGNIVRIFQEDSRVLEELTAPDFVAWALMQWYCRGNGEYYSIIRSKVVHFEKLSG